MRMTLEEFAAFMAKPWTCIDCGKTYHPQPDDDTTTPEGIRTQEQRLPSGDFKRVKIGDICYDCLHKILHE